MSTVVSPVTHTAEVEAAVDWLEEGLASLQDEEVVEQALILLEATEWSEMMLGECAFWEGIGLEEDHTSRIMGGFLSEDVDVYLGGRTLYVPSGSLIDELNGLDQEQREAIAESISSWTT